jgi:membrane associated rhomboid family serine protease
MSLTLIFLLITVAASIAAWNNPVLMNKWIFNPYQVWNRKEYYRFITSGFIHKDTLHLIFNMFVFYLFGGIVEDIFTGIFPSPWGSVFFGILYLAGIVISDIPTFIKHKSQPYYNALGASGGVASVLFSYILFQPLEKLCLYGLPFLCFPGILWAAVYIVYSYYSGKKGAGNINHDAHLYGAIFGIIFTIAVYPSIISIFIEQMKDFSLF